MNIENYEKYLSVINSDLEKIFDYQKEYIQCKKGCSLCCKKGNYPVSELEIKYLMLGYEKLDKEKKSEIKNRIEKIKETGDFESYECPFLFNDSCSVYMYRPLVCRTFGVLTEDVNGNSSFPFCCCEGLNYSIIYDKEKGHLSQDLVDKNNFSSPPTFFKLSNNVLMNIPLTKELNIDFGKTGRMIEILNNFKL